MLKRISFKIRNFYNECKITFYQFKNQPAYEIRRVSVCQKTGQHLIEIKITGKGQSISYFADEIVVDSDFLMKFEPADVRTITYLATCDRYEAILREEKIKKIYEIVRSRKKGRDKTMQLRNKEN